MKTFLLSLMFAAIAIAQTTLSTPTLAFDMEPSQGEVFVSSASGVTVGMYGYVDRELFKVNSISGTTLYVTRGIAGKLTAHTAGVTVYVGPSNGFTFADPAGRCTTRTTPTIPYINVLTGGTFECTSGTWTQTNGGGEATEISAEVLDPVLAPAIDGCITPTLNGAGEIEFPFNPACAGGLSGQTFTWTDDSETWMTSYLTPGGTQGFTPLFTYAQTPNDVGSFAFGGGDIANRWGVITFDYHATDDKTIFKIVKIPANFTSLDFKLETLGSAAAAGNIVYGTAYRCYSATAVSIGSDASAFGNAATATVAYTNLSSARVTGTISNVITVAGCPAGSLAQIKFSRKSAAAGTTFTGVASLVSITPSWNFSRTL